MEGRANCMDRGGCGVELCGDAAWDCWNGA